MENMETMEVQFVTDAEKSIEGAATCLFIIILCQITILIQMHAIHYIILSTDKVASQIK
jgi:hypothetical protein